MARVCKGLTTVTLNTIYRTDDAELLEFQGIAREHQPYRETLFEFFRGRRWPCRGEGSLLDAVQSGLELEKSTGEPFVWLCVTNEGARQVCTAALELLGRKDYVFRGFPTDPNQGECQLFYASPGIVVRMTRNVDKDRGYVNGAVGVVRRVLSSDMDGIPTVFTVELSTGVYILVHPIYDKKTLLFTLHLWLCHDNQASPRCDLSPWRHMVQSLLSCRERIWLCCRESLQEQGWHLSLREDPSHRLAPCP